MNCPRRSRSSVCVSAIGTHKGRAHKARHSPRSVVLHPPGTRQRFTAYILGRPRCPMRCTMSPRPSHGSARNSVDASSLRRSRVVVVHKMKKPGRRRRTRTWFLATIAGTAKRYRTAINPPDASSSLPRPTVERWHRSRSGNRPSRPCHPSTPWCRHTHPSSIGDLAHDR